MRSRYQSRVGLIVFAVLAVFSPSLIRATDAGSNDRDNDKDVPAWVRAKVESMQPTPEDRKFDEIGWTNSIVEAEKLARENHRPVFLFTQNGRIEIGRT
jgi:hypothetical protein